MNIAVQFVVEESQISIVSSLFLELGMMLPGVLLDARPSAANKKLRGKFFEGYCTFT